MTTMNRRDLLLKGGLVCAGSWLATHAVAQDTKPAPPRPPLPRTLPESWQRAPTVALWPGKPPGHAGYRAQPLPAQHVPIFLRNIEEPRLHVFRPERPNGEAVLAIPGGAYWFVSVVNEGVELAEQLTPRGLTVFVLAYRLPGEGWEARSDVPLQDAQRALRLIRARAEEWSLNPDKVSVLGFSAGGHLAATLATNHASQVYERVDRVDDLSARPHSAALIYPVITMDAQWTHKMSRDLLLGESPSEADIRRRSPELNVDAHTPPSFLVHAMDDDAVPVENSLRFMHAMREAKRPVEAHLLQEGGHAFGIGRPNTPSAKWIELYDLWRQRLDQSA